MTEKFIHDYESKIEEILARPSGIHTIDHAAITRWIDSQASERRRIAAAALRDNIIYISHAEVIEYCFELMRRMYTDAERPIQDSIPLKWYVGPEDKSSYFISLLCYDIAKKQGFRLPDEILVNTFDYKDCIGSTLFYLDDMSYSGSQIYKLLKNIYVAHLKAFTKLEKGQKIILKKLNISTIPQLDIRVGITCITTKASNLLKSFNFRYNYLRLPVIQNNGDAIPVNPYPIYFVREIPDLKHILGDQLYTDCIIFFNPFSIAPCICYFDHKLADPLSTFTYVLQFGVVPPSLINYDFIFSHEDRKLSELKPFYNQQTDAPDKEIPNTQFIPFITGCIPFTPEQEVELRRIPFEHLMIIYTDPVDEDESVYNFYGIPVQNIFELKNSPGARCPKSWYKNFFKGGMRKTKRKLKKQKKYTKSKSIKTKK